MNYPEVDKIVACVRKNEVSFEALPNDKQLHEIFYRKIRMYISGKRFDFPVCDEYNDVDQENPFVLMHLVLRECEDFEEAEGYLEWTKDLGLDSSQITVNSLYAQLGVLVPKMRLLIGKAVKAIPHWDIEMNTGLAKALRNSRQ